MIYIEVIDNVVTKPSLTIYQIRSMYPYISWPEVPGEDILAEYNIYRLHTRRMLGTDIYTEAELPPNVSESIGSITYNAELSLWEQVIDLVDNSLEVVKADEKARLADFRYNHEVSGFYWTYVDANNPEITDQVFVYTDRESQLKVTAAYTLAKDGLWANGSCWKFGYGKFKNMTAQDIINMTLAVVSYVQTCFQTESALASQVDQATSKAEAEAWQWP